MRRQRFAHDYYEAYVRSRRGCESPRAGIPGERVLEPRRSRCSKKLKGTTTVCGSTRYQISDSYRHGKRHLCAVCGASWPMRELMNPLITAGRKRSPHESALEAVCDLGSLADALGSRETRVFAAYHYAEPLRGQKTEVAALWMLREMYPRQSWMRDEVRNAHDAACRKIEQAAADKRLDGGRG